MKEVPSSYLGVWRRARLETADGAIDTSTRVYWLQTARLHADLRIPLPQPASARRSLAECRGRELLALSAQAGFAGVTEVEGDRCQWFREIDYQPVRNEPDAGLMRFIGRDRLIEDGLDGSYLEVWERLPESRGVNWGQRLIAADGSGRHAYLLVAGDCFLFAADRAEPLAAGGTLADQLAYPGLDDARRRERLGFELSFGRHHAGRTPWMIELSTLPGRAGAELLPAGRSWQSPRLALGGGHTLMIGALPPPGGWLPLLPKENPLAPEDIPSWPH